MSVPTADIPKQPRSLQEILASKAGKKVTSLDTNTTEDIRTENSLPPVGRSRPPPPPPPKGPNPNIPATDSSLQPTNVDINDRNGISPETDGVINGIPAEMLAVEEEEMPSSSQAVFGEGADLLQIFGSTNDTGHSASSDQEDALVEHLEPHSQPPLQHQMQLQPDPEQLDSFVSTIENLKQANANLSQQLDQARHEIDTSHQARDRALADAQSRAEQQVAHLQLEISQLHSAHVAELQRQQQLSGKSEQLDGLRSDFEALLAEKQRVESMAEAQREEFHLVKADIGSCRGDLNQARIDLGRMRNEVELRDRTIADMQAEIGRLRAELEGMQAKLQQQQNEHLTEKKWFDDQVNMIDCFYRVNIYFVLTR